MLARLDAQQAPAMQSASARMPASDEIARFCGDCHALPRPQSFEREAWYSRVRKGFEFYAQSGRTDLTVPTFESVLRYYRDNAPAAIQFPEPLEVDSAWRARFTTTKLDWKEGDYIAPAISSIRWFPQLDTDMGGAVVSDMRDGSVSLMRMTVDPAQTARKVLARLTSPARTIMHDLDRDGLQDLIVSDLGSFNPYDHGFGRVIWLRRTPGAFEFEARTLVSSAGRVADLALADFDGDGWEDLLVAEFGHRRVGGIRLLRNLSAESGEFEFESLPLDDRPGTIRLTTHDWDRDGREDFAALISQEHESIELFLNRASSPVPAGPPAGLAFHRIQVGTGPDLTYGSVGMATVDLDLDGDLDVLSVNGDCLDDNYAHLSHGVQWFENRGDLRFTRHRIADLPGAYQAVAADLDQDGDLDVVAVANLPASVQPHSLNAVSKTSILLLEQTGPREFTPRVLQRGPPRYASLECGDFNDDGRLDFVVGAQLFGNDPPASQAARLPRLTVWWNNL